MMGSFYYELLGSDDISKNIFGVQDIIKQGQEECIGSYS